MIPLSRKKRKWQNSSNVVFRVFDMSTFDFRIDCDISKYPRNWLSMLSAWFSRRITVNKMQANPDKFQAMAIGKKTICENISFNFDSVVIKPDQEIKLLGVYIDYLLNFNTHIRGVARPIMMWKHKRQGVWGPPRPPVGAGRGTRGAKPPGRKRMIYPTSAGKLLDIFLNVLKRISKRLCKLGKLFLNVLKRISKRLCKLGKLTIYHSFIMSNFNYGL